MDRGRPWRFDVDTSSVPIISEFSGGSKKWEISRNTSSAFKLLAAKSCKILSGCKKRCVRARVSGYKQAATDVATWASQTSTGGRQIAVIKLLEACNDLLLIQEKPTQHRFGNLRAQQNPIGMVSSTSVSPSSASASSSSGHVSGMSHQGTLSSSSCSSPSSLLSSSSSTTATTAAAVSARLDADSDDDDDDQHHEGPWDAADSAFSDELFKAGCFLFTQFYKERTKEIRLAYVCGYRDALDTIMKWSSSKSIPGQITYIPSATILTICTVMRAKSASRYASSRQRDGIVSSASDRMCRSGSPSRRSSPRGVVGGVVMNNMDYSPNRSFVARSQRSPSSVSRCSSMSTTNTNANTNTNTNTNTTPTNACAPQIQTDVGVNDAMSHWIPGSKREYVMDTDSEDEGRHSTKRLRLG